MLMAALKVIAAHGIDAVANRLHRVADRLQGEPEHDTLLEPVAEGHGVLLTPDAIDMLAPPPSLTRPTLVPPPPLAGSLAARGAPGK